MSMDDTRPNSAEDLPDYAPIPRSALGPALNEQGFPDEFSANFREHLRSRHLGE
jgi:hypothetical protein